MKTIQFNEIHLSNSCKVMSDEKMDILFSTFQRVKVKPKKKLQITKNIRNNTIQFKVKEMKQKRHKPAQLAKYGNA